MAKKPPPHGSIPLQRGDRVAAATTFANAIVVITERGRVMRIHPVNRAHDLYPKWQARICECEDAIEEDGGTL